MNNGGKNVVQNLLLQGGLWVNYRCSWVSGDLIMVVRGWMWVVAVKNDWLWVVVGGGGEIMVSRGWW